ncbi:hypothetical protein Tco_0440196, partial [Tanacetum coccineum]
FNDAREWAPTIEAIRAQYVARRDSDPLDIICRNKPGDDVALHFDMKDVYLFGFTVNGKLMAKQEKLLMISRDLPFWGMILVTSTLMLRTH